jgi:signal transduction histidine kinase
MAVFDNITVRKQVTRRLEHSESQLRKLSHRLIAVQEEERARIARDIHDQLIQELVLIKIITASITPKIKRDQIAVKAQQLRDLADRLIETTHRISVNLRPEMFDKLGLTKAIQWYAEEFEGNSGISCPVDCREDQPDIYVPKDISIAAYRIIQEATTNIMRHSKATQANIFMHVSKKTLSIKVTDNGTGFNYAKLADESSLGLIGMRERVRAVGGNITIKSKSQYGTSVSVRFTLC